MCAKNKNRTSKIIKPYDRIVENQTYALDLWRDMRAGKLSPEEGSRMIRALRESSRSIDQEIAKERNEAVFQRLELEIAKFIRKYRTSPALTLQGMVEPPRSAKPKTEEPAQEKKHDDKEYTP